MFHEGQRSGSGRKQCAYGTANFAKRLVFAEQRVDERVILGQFPPVRPQQADTEQVFADLRQVKSERVKRIPQFFRMPTRFFVDTRANFAEMTASRAELGAVRHESFTTEQRQTAESFPF